MISARHARFLLYIVLASFFPTYTAFTGKVLPRLPTAKEARKIEQVTPLLLATRPEEALEQAVEALKRTIIDEAAGTSNGLKATPQQRDLIAKAVNGLVALNPTNDIATSELATGTWDLIYTTTEGASGGKLGPFIGKVQQEVHIGEGLYVNYVRIGPLTGKLEATWEVVNARQWKVTKGSLRNRTLVTKHQPGSHSVTQLNATPEFCFLFALYSNGRVDYGPHMGHFRCHK